MDDQQHALSALLLTIPIVEAVPFDTGQPSPAIWVWLAVVIGTINPLRVASRTPGDRRNERARLGLAGAVVGSLALLAIGSLSGWMIDVADTSSPAMRLAAGSLCLLSAGIDLARRRVDDLPALAGDRAALVPVAIPLVVRPAIVIAGLSLVADHGLGGYALALTLTSVAIGLLAGLVPGDASTPRPLTAWAGRLLSFVAIAASVLLIADAVFDI